MKLKELRDRYPSIAFMLLCVLFIAVEGIFTFCGKVSCPGFVDPVYDSWFPYAGDQKFIFESAADKDTLYISSVDRSQPYQTSGGFESKGCNGGSNASVYGTTDTVRFSVNAWRDATTTVQFALGDFRMFIQSLNDNSFALNAESNSIQVRYSAFQVIGGKDFSDVQEFVSDTTVAKPTFYRVFLAKGKGLVAYQKMADHALYVLR